MHENVIIGSKWKEGDIIGIAADLGAKTLSFSVNGSFVAPNGVAFENIQCGAGGIFPAFSLGPCTIQFNFGEEPFKFSPPWDTE